MDLLGPYSRSEIAFLEKKSRKKSLQQVNPPLVSELRDIKNFRILKNRIFCDFLHFFADFRDLICGRNRPEMAGSAENYKKSIFQTL